MAGHSRILTDLSRTLPLFLICLRLSQLQVKINDGQIQLSVRSEYCWLHPSSDLLLPRSLQKTVSWGPSAPSSVQDSSSFIIHSFRFPSSSESPSFCHEPNTLLSSIGDGSLTASRPDSGPREGVRVLSVTTSAPGPRHQGTVPSHREK